MTLTALGHDLEVLQGIVGGVGIGALLGSAQSMANSNGHRRQLNDALLLASD